MFHHASVPHSLTECYTLFVGGWNCLDLYQKLEKGGEGEGGRGVIKSVLIPQNFLLILIFTTLTSHTAHTL